MLNKDDGIFLPSIEGVVSGKTSQVAGMNEIMNNLIGNDNYLDKRKMSTENTIEDLKKSKKYKLGDIVKVLGFHEKGNGSHHLRIAKSTDDGSGELGQGGIWWCIVHSGEVNVSWFGAKFDNIYNLDKAKENYYIVQRFFDYASNCKKLIFDGKGVLSLIGTTYLNKENSYLLIESGCNVKGKYNEGQNGIYHQSGSMICVGRYTNPYPPFNFQRHLVKNITIELNGTLETIYDNFNNTLNQDHNNNCVGIGSAFNVNIFGVGGVLGSDHKGICYDLECWGCTLDINFIENCYTNSFNMSANTPDNLGVPADIASKYIKYKNIVRINKTVINLDVIKDNYEDFKCWGGTVEVEIDSYDTIGTSSKTVSLGRVQECSLELTTRYELDFQLYQVIRHYDSGLLKIRNSTFNNTTNIVTVGGTPLSDAVITLDNVAVKGNCNAIINNEQSIQLKQDLIECDFLGITSDYAIINGTDSLSTSKVYGCRIDYTKISRKKRNILLEESYILTINNNSITIDQNVIFNRRFVTLMIYTSNKDTERALVTVPLEPLFVSQKPQKITYTNVDGAIKRVIVTYIDVTGYAISVEANENIAYAIAY
ncbi:MAG: hypothetical protein ACRCXT_03510 [Paraclostridium sp.]